MTDLICPNCKKKLDRIIEEYHSIGTYTYSPNNNKYEVNSLNDIETQYFIRCGYCNQILSNTIVASLIKQLPKV